MRRGGGVPCAYTWGRLPRLPQGGRAFALHGVLHRAPESAGRVEGLCLAVKKMDAE